MSQPPPCWRMLCLPAGSQPPRREPLAHAVIPGGGSENPRDHCVEQGQGWFLVH